MDRRNYNKIKLLLFIVLLEVLISCTLVTKDVSCFPREIVYGVYAKCISFLPEPEWNDMVGVWQSDDGALIVLKDDGVAALIDVNWEKMSDYYFCQCRGNCFGRWELCSTDQTDMYHVLIDLGTVITPMRFEISGRFEILPPWEMIYIISNVDTLDFYEFKKIR